MLRSPLRILVSIALGLVLGSADRALAQEEPGREQVWEGYLYRSEPDGPVKIGSGVIAMGVMAQPARRLGPDLAKGLESCVSRVGDDYFFWNYAWIGTENQEGARRRPIERVPRVLVRVRGRVVSEEREGATEGIFGSSAPMTMVAGKVESIEFLEEAWLSAWQAAVTPDFNPWWPYPASKTEGDRDASLRIASEAVQGIARMREASRVTDALKAKAAAVAPGAQPANSFQADIEDIGLRWLYAQQERHGYEIEGLAALGPLAPDRQEITDWFCKAETKASFLERVRARWPGDLGRLRMYYYLQAENRTSYTVVRLDEVSNWSDEAWTAHRDLTRRTLAGR